MLITNGASRGDSCQTPTSYRIQIAMLTRANQTMPTPAAPLSSAPRQAWLESERQEIRDYATAHPGSSWKGKKRWFEANKVSNQPDSKSRPIEIHVSWKRCYSGNDVELRDMHKLNKLNRGSLRTYITPNTRFVSFVCFAMYVTFSRYMHILVISIPPPVPTVYL